MLGAADIPIGAVVKGGATVPGASDVAVRTIGAAVAGASAMTGAAEETQMPIGTGVAGAIVPGATSTSRRNQDGIYAGMNRSKPTCLE